MDRIVELEPKRRSVGLLTTPPSLCSWRLNVTYFFSWRSIWSPIMRWLQLFCWELSIYPISLSIQGIKQFGILDNWKMGQPAWKAWWKQIVGHEDHLLYVCLLCYEEMSQTVPIKNMKSRTVWFTKKGLCKAVILEKLIDQYSIGSFHTATLQLNKIFMLDKRDNFYLSQKLPQSLSWFRWKHLYSSKWPSIEPSLLMHKQLERKHGPHEIPKCQTHLQQPHPPTTDTQMTSKSGMHPGGRRHYMVCQFKNNHSFRKSPWIDENC